MLCIAGIMERWNISCLSITRPKVCFCLLCFTSLMISLFILCIFAVPQVTIPPLKDSTIPPFNKVQKLFLHSFCPNSLNHLYNSNWRILFGVALLKEETNSWVKPYASRNHDQPYQSLFHQPLGKRGHSLHSPGSYR